MRIQTTLLADGLGMIYFTWQADLVEEIGTSDGKIVKITGVPKPCKTASILCRGSNKMVSSELHADVDYDCMYVLWIAGLTIMGR
jgi:hypothetical protein